jgi:hypothetical protein
LHARRWLALPAVVITLWVAAPGSAGAFGTIDSGGQNREHERITRAALSCAGIGELGADCFEPRSMDWLAGHDHLFGAIGAPDRDELSLPAAHCDNTDFLADDGYPRSRDQASTALTQCIEKLRSRFDEAVAAAAGLVDEHDAVVPAAVDMAADCTSQGADSRAKCTVIEGLGRTLHGAQDFYAHSNWADAADPGRPIGDDNPPGLDRPGPSPVLDLRGDSPDIPTDLTGGCYALRDQVPGVGECTRRVTHAALNKDRGLIDPKTGEATKPTTPRGMVGDNFAKAVAGAIAESRRQWQDLHSALTDRYGRERGDRMICALSHDDAVNACAGSSWGWIAGIGLAVCLAAATTATILWRRRRRSAR